MSNPERTQDKDDAAEVKNFTRTPNMLIFGYRELSPQEKWLYVCLKHLCGARGTRYLALRYVSEQTGISVGALSTSKDKNGKVNEGMIRHLHTAGLIHAEVKKKDGKGNPLYHITITDVWALNQAFFIERNQTRSDFGQDENETSEPVRSSDVPVQISDKPDRTSDKVVRNSDEPVRIPGQIQDYSKTNNKITDKTDKQEGTYSDVPENATRAIAQPAPDASHIIRGRQVGTNGIRSATFEDMLRAQQAESSPDSSSLPTPPATSKPASQARSEQDSVAGDRSQQARTASGPAQASGYEKTVQATSQATTPRQSARQAPTFSNAPLFASTKPARPTLTAEGKLVREWYQVIRSTRVRLTDDNINACNGLSEEDGISFEALKEAIEYWDDDKYVKDHEIAIDLQKLEDPKGAFTFAKAMLILRKRKKPANTTPKPTAPKPSDNPYDLANIMAMRPLPTTGATL